MYREVDEWTDEWMVNGYRKECSIYGVLGLINLLVRWRIYGFDRWVEQYIENNKRMDEWIYSCMDGWMDRPVDGWIIVWHHWPAHSKAVDCH